MRERESSTANTAEPTVGILSTALGQTMTGTNASALQAYRIGQLSAVMLGERLNGMQAPLSAVASRSPITIELSEAAQVLVCCGETITESPDEAPKSFLRRNAQRRDSVAG